MNNVVSGLKGMLDEVSLLMNKAKNDIQSEEDKVKFDDMLEKSGVRKEFESVRERFKDVMK